MTRRIHPVIEARNYEIRAAKDCARCNGETSMKAMLKNFVETEMRNYAFDDLQRSGGRGRRLTINGA